MSRLQSLKDSHRLAALEQMREQAFEQGRNLAPGQGHSLEIAQVQKADRYSAPETFQIGHYESSSDSEDEVDRNNHMVSYAKSKGRGRMQHEPTMPGEGAWGGSLCKLTNIEVGDPREDAVHIPIGYARYTAPGVKAEDYTYHRVGGWRVAVPKKSKVPVHKLLQRIQNTGPQSVGYVRVGDTLVPGHLGPGDRATLAQIV